MSAPELGSCVDARCQDMKLLSSDLTRTHLVHLLELQRSDRAEPHLNGSRFRRIRSGMEEVGDTVKTARQLRQSDREQTSQRSRQRHRMGKLLVYRRRADGRERSDWTGGDLTVPATVRVKEGVREGS